MATGKKDLKQYFSCKRKPDIVTGIAIGLFLIVILLQVYLIVFLPVQLREGEALAYNMARDKMLRDIDKLRSALPKVKMPDELAEGELQMTKSAFERLMLYTREHRDGLDLAQVSELAQRFRMFDFMLQRWTAGKPQYYLRREKIDQKKYVRMLEKRIQEQETISQ
ncbi:MAG: hypothetical protein J6C30_08340 [Lentisphaeria bacterium]|nr:hypothetical protein [Lentisphaeria bacterium]